MPVVRFGEVWRVRIGGAEKTVKVIASSTTPGWWWCSDQASGDMIMAAETSFLERLEPSPDQPPPSEA